MNILLATPLYSQHYDAGHFWLRALQAIGNVVTIWDYRLEPDRVPHPHNMKYDLVIVLKGPVPYDKLKTMFNCPVFCYWPDKFERDTGIETLLQRADKVFTPVRPTPDWMEWLPTGWDPLIHKHVDMMSKHHQSLYIGTNNSMYKAGIVSLIKPQMIFGNGWVNPPIYLHELVREFNLSSVLVDIHQAPDTGLNRKFFEMIACGFTIVDDVPGVRDILGVELSRAVIYKSGAEARAMIAHFSTDEHSREALWEEELEAIQDYTYEAAAERMLSVLTK